MRLSEVEKKAKEVGIKDTWRYTRKELIRVIQKQEGNSPCFMASNNDCPQAVCCWREDCIR